MKSPKSTTLHLAVSMSPDDDQGDEGDPLEHFTMEERKQRHTLFSVFRYTNDQCLELTDGTAEILKLLFSCWFLLFSCSGLARVTLGVLRGFLNSAS